KKVKKIKHAHNIAMKYVFVIPKNKCSPVKPSTCISFNYTSILEANKEKVKFLFSSFWTRQFRSTSEEQSNFNSLKLQKGLVRCLFFHFHLSNTRNRIEVMMPYRSWSW
ncbi:MAG: hypothetical protein PHH15_02585, partial [Candidatus Pacebacteria bacterium]|nr:hypothetical protein [Candidatus Paceibacterota bacterium]